MFKFRPPPRRCACACFVALCVLVPGVLVLCLAFMETLAHTSLKRLAIAHLRREGYLASACEVRCQIARWIVDVAGWRDGWFDPARQQRIRLESPQTVIIECKQSRSDFLRDNRRLDAMLALRERLDGIRRSLEEHHIKALEPQLRIEGSSLFAELDEWDFAASRLPSYQRVLRRLEQIEERLHGQTKFFRLSRYGLADALYLAASKGMIRRREVPPGWGLLECSEEALRWNGESSLFESPPMLTVKIEAPPRRVNEAHRHRLLRNIAIAACMRR
jgi:hypothetical protein